MGPDSERRSGEPRVLLQLRRTRAVRRRHASGGLAPRATLPLAGACVQPPRPVRAAARRRKVRAAPYPRARTGRRTPGYAEPEPRGLRRAVRSAPVLRPRDGARMALSLPPEERMTRLSHAHLAPQTGTGLVVHRGELLRIIDPTGEQVSDMISFAQDDPREWLSS